MAHPPGPVIGNYRLIRHLGKGGYADVYLAQHLLLPRQVAIKLLHALSVEEVRQFTTEARLVAQLGHPHILPILDFGIEEKANHTPYLVMPYAPNGTLRQRHPDGTQLPLTTIIAAVKQIADALHFAHSNGVIHRDVKPENLLVGGDQELFLSDFGAAVKASMRTQSSIGTPLYMAPEQAMGHPEPASDQYALGVLVYEWIAGARPFHGSLLSVLYQHQHVPPPPLRPGVPWLLPAVEQVVLRALAKHPGERFPSVQAFAEALEQAISPPQGKLLLKYQHQGGPIEALAWLPNGQQLVFGGDDRTVSCLDVFSGRVILVYKEHKDQILALAVSPDGQTVASGSADKTIHLWEPATGQRRLPQQGRQRLVHTRAVRALAWSPDGCCLASGGDDRQVRLWDAATHEELSQLRHEDAVRSVAWSPDGRLLASADDDQQLHVWELVIQGSTTHREWANALAWSPDGRLLASASKVTKQGGVRIWLPTTQGEIGSYSQHTQEVYTLAWSPDGRFLASAGADLMVHIWNPTTRETVFIYQGHLAPQPQLEQSAVRAITAVAWAPDSRRIASAGTDGIIHIWQAI